MLALSPYIALDPEARVAALTWVPFLPGEAARSLPVLPSSTPSYQLQE